MKTATQNLIDDLVADLKPIEAPGRISRPVVFWLAIATVYSIVSVFVSGPLREGSLLHLVELPLFAGETLLAAIAIAVAAIATLRLALPGRNGPMREFGTVFILLALWVGIYVAAFWYPVHPVSTFGGRGDCVWQVPLFSLPSLAVLLYLANRQYPLWPRTTGLLAGVAAAAIPAELMQFGCMYEPAHILTHHMAPILVTAAIGWLVGPFVLRPRRVVPRRRDVAIH
jgi:hypothetical protein